MGTALLSFAGFFTPLHSLATRWMPMPKRRGASLLRYVTVRPACAVRTSQRAGDPNRPLRVVRMLDAQTPRSYGSRMVISGRMADVCAELDRLAALEESARTH
jgi:hypothetical protein